MTVLRQDAPLLGPETKEEDVRAWPDDELVHCLVQSAHYLMSCCDTANETTGPHQRAWVEAAKQAGRDLKAIKEEALRRMKKEGQ